MNVQVGWMIAIASFLASVAPNPILIRLHKFKPSHDARAPRGEIFATKYLAMHDCPDKKITKFAVGKAYPVTEDKALTLTVMDDTGLIHLENKSDDTIFTYSARNFQTNHWILNQSVTPREAHQFHATHNGFLYVLQYKVLPRDLQFGGVTS
ncbi:hypothetical protein PTTG_26549 [Puccinia triticina 1-1 BBBD Race 1]|uniref:Uncharacterized protein n=2 Tax=Puccinia triticina TaxID=208348 RepID=A0A180GSF9_PUCT1|nr:uncharacterized protein PtA15_14A127 [Puccinia triticina]OAV95665.1 hypothetical protein PTTG_26549 [Puccinia triticina 1-1 BBBD Race 1]WAQ91245.1 hypothetical protein PtA15_14A127 [Puccinia triticina]